MSSRDSLLDDPRGFRNKSRNNAPSIDWWSAFVGTAVAFIVAAAIAIIVVAILTLVRTSDVSSHLKNVDDDLKRHYDVEQVGPDSASAILSQVVVANFCREATPVRKFGCDGSSRCYVPFTTFESDEDYISFDASNPALINIDTKNQYTLRLIVKGRTFCSFHVVEVNVISINGSSQTVLATGYLGAHNSVNITKAFLLSAGTQLAVEINDPVTNADMRLYSEGLLTKTDDYDHLVESTTYDLTRNTAWQPARPSSAPSTPSLQFPPQYTTSSTVYPWLSPVIPAEPITGALPFGIPNDWGYHKFQSVPFSIGDFMGLNMEDIDPADPQLSLFLTDRNYRGKDERRKAVYMTALRACVMPEYRPKARAFLNRVYSDVTTYNKPLMSSFKVALIDYLLDLHVGVADHPVEAKDFFDEFITFLGVGSPIAAGRDERVLLGRSYMPAVRAYFASRNSIIIKEKDSSSIIYYWHLAGLSPEGLVMETVHNAIAFSQFLHTLYKLVVDKMVGTTQPVAGVIQYNFFAKHQACGTDKVCRLNVAREAMRLLVVNSVSFSDVEDPDSTDSIKARLLHQSIMVGAWANLTGNAAAYFGYNAGIYSSIIDYNTSIDDTVCSTADSSPLAALEPDQLFTRAALSRDNQTFFDADNVKLLPTFLLPIYAPFGLGYRRCAGEILVMDIVDLILEIFADITWVTGAVGTPSQECIAPFLCVANDIYADNQAPHQ